MKYQVLDGLGQLHVIELPVNAEISWQDFVALTQIRQLAQPIQDVTPWDMLKQPKSIDTEQDSSIIDSVEDGPLPI